MAPPRKPSDWPSLDARRRLFSDLQWLAMPLHMQLGIVPEVREVATTDYVSGFVAGGHVVNNHRFRYRVSVARAAR